MNVTSRAIIASLVGVFTCTISYGAAVPMEKALSAPDENYDLDSQQFLTEGHYYCSLPALDRIDKVVVKPRALTEQALIYLRIRPDKGSVIRIHHRLLNGILGHNSIRYRSTSQTKSPYFQFKGSIITRQNDTVVANFENNALLQANQLDPSVRKTDMSFFGLKFWLGRHTGHDENNRETDVNAYLRIIIDWEDQASQAKEISVYRAAYVVSQVSVTEIDGSLKEMFYRFLPNRSPFQTLACVPVDALDI